MRALVAAEQEGRLPKGAANLALGSSPQPGEIVCKLTLSGITEELPASRDFLTDRRGHPCPVQAPMELVDELIVGHRVRRAALAELGSRVEGPAIDQFVST